jgi:inner membrane protein
MKSPSGVTTQMFVDEIAKLGPSLWFAVGLGLMVLETVVPGVHFLWFGVAAAIVGVLALLVPMALSAQLILFSLISIVTVFLVRRSSRGGNAKSDEPALNVRGAHYIGRTVTVEEPIKDGRGKVRVGDTIWAAEGEDALKGAQVEITGVNGTVLVVSAPDAD